VSAKHRGARRSAGRGGFDVIVVDTATGDSQGVLDRLNGSSAMRVGQVMAEYAHPTAPGSVDQGADGVKVGIGPGSICNHRVVAGVGIRRSPRPETSPPRSESGRAARRRRRRALFRGLAKAVAAGAHAGNAGQPVRRHRGIAR